MIWLHILKEDARLWHRFTSRENVKRYLAHNKQEEIRFRCRLIKEGPMVLPVWVLEARLLERGPREWFEVRRGCWRIHTWLTGLAFRFEAAEFWSAGWFMRRLSFLCERRVKQE